MLAIVLLHAGDYKHRQQRCRISVASIVSTLSKKCSFLSINLDRSHALLSPGSWLNQDNASLHSRPPSLRLSSTDEAHFRYLFSVDCSVLTATRRASSTSKCLRYNLWFSIHIHDATPQILFNIVHYCLSSPSLLKSERSTYRAEIMVTITRKNTELNRMVLCIMVSTHHAAAAQM